MVDWPSTVPQDFLLGLTIEPVDPRLETQMEAGPPKTRLLDVSAEDPVKGRIYLKHDQYLALETFRKTTIKYGTILFDWHDPITGSTVKFRWVNVKYRTDTASGRIIADIELMRQP